MFYAPRQIWKRFEGGRLKFCAHAMSEPELDEVKRQERVEKLLKCYRKFKSKGYGYAYKFLGLELFNLFNAAAQMVLMNKLMGGRWIDYGLRLWEHYNFEGDQLYQVGKILCYDMSGLHTLFKLVFVSLSTFVFSVLFCIHMARVPGGPDARGFPQNDKV